MVGGDQWWLVVVGSGVRWLVVASVVMTGGVTHHVDVVMVVGGMVVRV